jgi:putative alpha-1,2-mannosidase
MARSLGSRSDVEKYLDRSMNWANLFKGDQKSLRNGTDTGFTGFFQPRYLNGTWGFQDALKCSNIDNDPTSVCSLQRTGSETFESSVWEYSL